MSEVAVPATGKLLTAQSSEYTVFVGLLGYAVVVYLPASLIFLSSSQAICCQESRPPP